jgi:hypothetical protein
MNGTSRTVLLLLIGVLAPLTAAAQSVPLASLRGIALAYENAIVVQARPGRPQLLRVDTLPDDTLQLRLPFRPNRLERLGTRWRISRLPARRWRGSAARNSSPGCWRRGRCKRAFDAAAAALPGQPAAVRAAGAVRGPVAVALPTATSRCSWSSITSSTCYEWLQPGRRARSPKPCWSRPAAGGCCSWPCRRSPGRVGRSRWSELHGQGVVAPGGARLPEPRP